MRLLFPIATERETTDATSLPQTIPSLRILLVDDDPLLLKTLRDILESEGHAVTAADGGQRGIDEFHEACKRGEPFTVVITDLGMPKVNGQAVAAAVKSARPQIKVVLLTGWAQRQTREGERPANIDRVLSKPPKLSELRTALAELAVASGVVAAGAAAGSYSARQKQ
jgi:CheY-like chemotaxis protein